MNIRGVYLENEGKTQNEYWNYRIKKIKNLNREWVQNSTPISYKIKNPLVGQVDLNTRYY